MTLRELIDRLSTRSVVDGLAVIGSGADGTMNDVSDCDLLVGSRKPTTGWSILSTRQPRRSTSFSERMTVRLRSTAFLARLSGG